MDGLSSVCFALKVVYVYQCPAWQRLPGSRSYGGGPTVRLAEPHRRTLPQLHERQHRLAVCRKEQAIDTRPLHADRSVCCAQHGLGISHCGRVPLSHHNGLQIPTWVTDRAQVREDSGKEGERGG